MTRFFAILATAASLAACQTPSTTMQTLPVTQTSQLDFAATEARLRDAIASRGFTLFTVVDHGAGARSVGRDIGESKLFVFGNPKGGTPLMEQNAAFGLELPLKVLLFEDGGSVRLATRDMGGLGAAYSVDVPPKIDAALSAIVGEARGLQP